MRIQTNIQNLNNYKIYLQIEQAVNEFLQKKGYLKLDLPVLSPALIPESYLEVFETGFLYFDKKDKLYLTPSPELFMKRLIAYGVGDCYYLGKSFRNNEANSSLHSFEFNMLEFYKVNASYMDIADEVLEMLNYIKQKIIKAKLKIKGRNLDFSRFEKLKVMEAFERWAGISESELFNHQLFIEKARKKGYQVAGFSYEELWSQIYVQEIEPYLGKNGYPTLIYDYPKEFAALAKLNSDNKTAQRFEFYIEGVELGDCYTELTDWREQQMRFKEEAEKRKKIGRIVHPIDKGFIDALKYGLPSCAGIAIGFDRLVMVFLGENSINNFKLITINEN